MPWTPLLLAQVGVDPSAPEPETAISLPGWTFFVVLAVCGVVALVLHRSLTGHARRGDRIAQAAAGLGLTYSYEDRWALRRLRFGVLAGAPHLDVVNVVSGAGPDGVPVRAFDALLWDEVEADRRGRSGGLAAVLGGEPAGAASAEKVRVERGAVSATLVPVPAYLPHLVVLPASLVHGAFDLAGLPDVDTESEAFNRTFRVVCRDRRFAQLFLDALMIDALLEAGAGYGLEVRGSWMLLWRRPAEPEELVRMVGLGAELRRRVPGLVLQGWPRPADQSAATAPVAGGRSG